MKDIILKFINNNKWFVVFYLVWGFIHIILFVNGGHAKNDFWPFTYKWYSRLWDYNLFELIVYMVLPWIIFIINNLVGEDIRKVWKKYKQNN